MRGPNTRSNFSLSGSIGTVLLRTRVQGIHAVEGTTIANEPPREGEKSLLLRASRLAVYYELTKPGIAGYVMVTAGVAY